MLFLPAGVSAIKRSTTSSDVTRGTFPLSSITTPSLGTGFSKLPNACTGARDIEERAEREGAGDETRSSARDRRGFFTSSSSSRSDDGARLRFGFGFVAGTGCFEDDSELDDDGRLGGADRGDEVEGAFNLIVGTGEGGAIGFGLTTLLTRILAVGAVVLKRSFGRDEALRLCP